MGSNPTQALGIVSFLAAFTLLAGAFAGGGILCEAGFIILLGIAIFFFAKCKPWEHRSEGAGTAVSRMTTREAR